MKLASLIEKDMIRRMGFGAKGYNVGVSLKSAFAEFYPEALDSYAEQIMNSNAAPETKDEAIKLLNSIKAKGEDLETLLGDFNFDDESAIGAELYRKLSGDTDPGEEDTLIFYDFNIDSSIKSGMFENVVGLLDELDSFFYVLIGMLGASGEQKPEPKRMGFRQAVNEDDEQLPFEENQIREIIKESLNELEGSVDYADFFQKIINRLDSAEDSKRELGSEIIGKFQDLDISIDYLTSAMTGKSPHEIGTDQDSQGIMTGPSPGHVRLNKQKIREAIRKEIKKII